MPSVIPGFDYDIFISYRHNDNRSGWVTDFVNALQEELAATIKESLSIYFDENPHDGLHEHHDVDDSLKDKLKCLIFIPILSRTYCDPKSFAFEHEFKPFVQMAASDSLGLKIKLLNGNVASRVLPVRIHDLDKEDVAAFESVTGSVVRSIDFVFQSTGVNRPLRSQDDDIKEISHTLFYRDQINKVANAIREIASGLKQGRQHPSDESLNTNAREHVKIKSGKKLRLPIAIGAAILFTAFVVGLILKPDSLKPASESGLAVLPFTNNSGRADLDFLSVGMASEIRSRLSMSKQFNFISALQATLPYLKEPKTPKEVGDDLGVDYILSGIYQADGDRIRVEAEFLDAKTGRLVWALPIEKELSGIFEMQGDIAAEVIKRFSVSEQLVDEVGGTTNMEAYMEYTEGVRLFESVNWADSSQERALIRIRNAVKLDSGYARAWEKLLEMEGLFYINNQYDIERVSRITGYVRYIRSHFPNSWIRDQADAYYFMRIAIDYDLALQSFSRVLEQDENNSVAIGSIAVINKRKLQFEKAIQGFKKLIQLNPNGDSWFYFAQVLEPTGDHLSTLKVRLKAWELLKSLDAAQAVFWSAAKSGYPFERLPEDLLKKAGYWTDVWKAHLTSDWPGLLKVAKKEKNFYQTAFAFNMLNQHDSARFWAKKVLQNDPGNWDMLAIAGEPKKAMEFIDKWFDHQIGKGDDRLAQCWKINNKILVMVLLKDYAEATRLLKKLNEDFQEYQDFEEYFRFGGYDDIKKNYPPFNEALKNLKRRPIPDVSQYIRLD